MTEAVSPAAANLAQRPQTEEALRGNLTGFVDGVAAHYGAIAQNGENGHDFIYSRGVADRPPYSSVEAFDFPDRSRREVVTRADGTITTTVRLSDAVVDGYGRRVSVSMTEGGDQPTSYALGFSESDKKLTRKQRADGVSVRSSSHFTWSAEQPISYTRSGLKKYAVEAGTPQFEDVADVGSQAERAWQNMRENLNPDSTFNNMRAGRRGVAALGAVAAKLLRLPGRRR